MYSISRVVPHAICVSYSATRQRYSATRQEYVKGTYWKITDRSKEDILEDVLLELRRIILPFKRQGKGWEMIVDSINRDSTKAAKGGRLCKFYVIWKLHKAANAIGLRSRPIAAAIDYVTGPASHFLHTQLKEESGSIRMS